MIVDETTGNRVTAFPAGLGGALPSAGYLRRWKGFRTHQNKLRIKPTSLSPSWPRASRLAIPGRWDCRGCCTIAGAWVAGTRPAMTIWGRSISHERLS
jgi:hypothetical protein